ncbi:MAG: hypothetical protein H7289_15775, partial [Mucilaginibacter sp.]|nr:hypothetical protein [Mucilaginibacter sp.]
MKGIASWLSLFCYKFMVMKSLLFIWCCFISVGVFGQTPKAIEADLLKLFRGINTNSSDVDKANTEFSRKLIYYAEKYPASIKWPFESLKKENLNISTSSDNMLRIYSWDTWSGGTMHYFESVFQYKVADKTKTLSDASKAVVDDRPSYYRLYTFNADGKTYYLAIWRGIGSSKDAETGIHSFTIENKELKRSK